MANAAKTSTLQLRFTSGELTGWAFRYNDAPESKVIETRVGDGRANRLKWDSPGVRALTLFFLRYAASTDERESFALSDEDEPLIKALAGQLERPSWIADVFYKVNFSPAVAASADSTLKVLFRPTDGDNRNGRATPKKPRIVRVHADRLPRSSVFVIRDGQRLIEPGDIAALADTISSADRSRTAGNGIVQPAASALNGNSTQTALTSGPNAAREIGSDCVELAVEARAHATLLQANFAVRWGLNRRGAVVIIKGGSADTVYNRLVETELMLAKALEKTRLVGMSARSWLQIHCRYAAGTKGWQGLGSGSPMAVAPLSALADQGAQLGILVGVDCASEQKSAAHRLVRDIHALLQAKDAAMNASVVFHVRDDDLARTVGGFVSQIFNPPCAFPSEIVTITQDSGAEVEKGDEKNAFWSEPPLPGQAFWRACQMADPESKRLQSEEFTVLAASLREKGEVVVSGPNCGCSPLPQDIVADLQRLDGKRDQATAQLIRLLKPCDGLRATTIGLVKLLTAQGSSESRMAVLKAAASEFDLVEAWLDGLPIADRRALPQWWLNAGPEPLAAVLATLIRLRSQRNGETGAILRQWTPFLSPRVRAAVEFAVQCAENGMHEFWGSATHHDALLFFADCGLIPSIPFAELSPEWLGKSEFWRLVQRRPLEPELVGWLLGAKPEHRATVGLCSRVEWTALAESNLLPQILKLRG